MHPTETTALDAQLVPRDSTEQKNLRSRDLALKACVWVCKLLSCGFLRSFLQTFNES